VVFRIGASTHLLLWWGENPPKRGRLCATHDVQLTRKATPVQAGGGAGASGAGRDVGNMGRRTQQDRFGKIYIFI